MKSDALFSYQPPFNLFAFLILWPLSWVLSPRALHSTNVFLIKLTVSAAIRHRENECTDGQPPLQSFPTLIIIAVYERYLAKGQSLRESGTGAAYNIYNSFTKGVKRVPFLERLVSSSATDLYDAIFDVEVTHDFDLFHDSDDEGAHNGLSSRISRESLHATSLTPAAGPSRSRSRRRGPPSVPRTPTSPTGKGRFDGSPHTSPYHRGAALPALLEPSSSGEIQTIGPRSPLNRLFTSRREFSASQERLSATVSADLGLKKLENMVDEIRQLPVNKLKEEMKELQVSLATLVLLCADANVCTAVIPGASGSYREPVADANTGNAQRDRRAFYDPA